MSEYSKHQLILVALCALTYFTNLGGTHLWDEDEAHFGSTALEMKSRRDYVVPYFNGEISFHKPAFTYWVMLANTQIFGNSEFALRFGSTLFSIGTVLLTYHAAQMLFTPRAGFWSAVALATCLQFMLVSRAAVADPALVFFCTLPIVIFIAARRSSFASDTRYSAANGDTGLSWKAWVLAYASMGVACLVKGPVGVVLPTAVLGLFLLFEHADQIGRQRADAKSPSHWLKRFAVWLTNALWPTVVLRTIWAMRPFTAVMVVAAIAAPWYIAVGFQTNGDWLRGFFLIHNAGRFTTSLENHDGGPLYYILAACVGMFPWCILYYQGLRSMIERLGNDDHERRAYLLLIAMVLVWLGAFSISGTKLPHYILPAYPAIAILLGSFIDRWLTRGAWLRAAWSVLILVGIGILVGGRIALSTFLPNEMHLLLVGLVPLIGGIVGFWAYESNRHHTASVTLLFTALGFTLGIFGWAAPQVSRYQTSPHVASWIQDHAITEQPRVKSYAYFEESLVYYCRQKVEQLSDPQLVAIYFNELPHDAFLITTREGAKELKPNLPEGVVQLESMPRFLRDGEVVLLGRATRTAATNKPSEETRFR